MFILCICMWGCVYVYVCVCMYVCVYFFQVCMFCMGYFDDLDHILFTSDWRD